MATETFNSTTSWECPQGVSSVEVECWGAGGKGGIPDVDLELKGIGGGGGAYSKSTLDVTPGNNYTIHVGISDDASGGDTYFNDSSTVLAKGGENGGTNIAAAGGLAAEGVGTTKYSGGSSSTSFGTGASSAGTSSNGTNSSDGTNGAIAPEGGGNGGSLTGGTINASGLPGSAPGGGGGGANPFGTGGALGGAGRITLVYTIESGPSNAPVYYIDSDNPIQNIRPSIKTGKSRYAEQSSPNTLLTNNNLNIDYLDSKFDNPNYYRRP
jgi:hypothetical protein